MKIGIVTFVKCDNYGAELQAYALQWKLNQLGYDAELIDLQKIEKDLASNASSILPAIKNRFKVYGWKAPFEIGKLVVDVLQRKLAAKKNESNAEEKHKLFLDFFDKFIRHSNRYYTIEEIRHATDLPYDVYIAGSDQIWNYMHNDNLDVYFLEFAKEFGARRISYAASISAASIPAKYQDEYRNLLKNIQYLSVRELHGAKLIKELTGRDVEVVLDPTLLVTSEEWLNNVAKNPLSGEKYVLVYTLSGSKYIQELCDNIAGCLGCKVVNMKINFRKDDSEKMTDLFDLGPQEWVGLISGASYVVTDSFHGTAFSINFNKPFTTLVNPVSNMNSRVLSILKIMGLEDRIIYDDGTRKMPKELYVDYTEVNKRMEEWRHKSLSFIKKSLDV